MFSNNDSRPINFSKRSKYRLIKKIESQKLNLSISEDEEGHQELDFSRSGSTVLENQPLTHKIKSSRLKYTTTIVSSSSNEVTNHVDEIAFNNINKNNDSEVGPSTANDKGNHHVEDKIESEKNKIFEEMRLPFFEENAEINFKEECARLGADLDHSSEERCKDNEQNDPPLYEGCKLTVMGSLIVILTLAMVHNLSGQCLADLLMVIYLHCLTPNHCTKTLYHLSKIFSNIKAPIKFHYFCGVCFSELESRKNECVACPSKANDEKSVSFFIEIPLIWQLQKIFSRPGMYEQLDYRFKRKKNDPNNIEDIYDGKLYQKYTKKGGFLSNSKNISFMWYSDGVPVFKSNKLSLWPVFLCINEFSYKERLKKKNMLIAGLWYGEKPYPNAFMKTLIPNFKKCYEGFEICLPCNEKKTMKGILLCGTCDSPARCIFTGMVQFNGYYGCHYCYIKGIHQETVTFPFVENEKIALRTHDETSKYASKSVKMIENKIKEKENKKKEKESKMKEKESEMKEKESKMKKKENELKEKENEAGKKENEMKEKGKETEDENSCFGVKEPSVLSKIMPDMINGIGIDVMHCVFLGIMKKLMDFWFSVDYRLEPFSLYYIIDVVDSKLSKICPPNFIKRSTRSFKEFHSYWKASEYKNFMLYYSIPLLLGLLPVNYLQNYIDLVFVIFTLSKPSITPIELSDCESRIKRFVLNFQKLYGSRFMTSNFHQLLHLPHIVNQLGPLWVYSCFAFEDLNGQILSLVHGTRYVEQQIASKFFMIWNLDLEIDKIKSDNVQQFCKSLIHRKPRLKINEKINDDIYSVGTYKYLPKIIGSLKEVLILQNIFVENCWLFDRLLLKNRLYTTENYCANLKTTSSYVYFNHECVRKFGIIQYFVKICNSGCMNTCPCPKANFFVVIKVGKTSSFISVASKSVPHIKEFSLTEECVLVSIDNLDALIICVLDKYICEPANTLEAE